MVGRASEALMSIVEETSRFAVEVAAGAESDDDTKSTEKIAEFTSCGLREAVADEDSVLSAVDEASSDERSDAISVEVALTSPEELLEVAVSSVAVRKAATLDVVSDAIISSVVIEAGTDRTSLEARAVEVESSLEVTSATASCVSVAGFIILCGSR